MKRTVALSLYEAVLSYDAEQNPVKTWVLRHPVTYEGVPVTYEGGYVSTETGAVRGNLQPRSLTEEELKMYGFAGHSARVLYFDNDEDVVVGTRLYDGELWYDVRGVSVWPKHSKAILEPV